MGNRDYWPYNRDYWTKWGEHNRDYWNKWAEHNKEFLNSPQAQRYVRHCGRGRMVGKLIIFGLGFGAGAIVAHRYNLPAANPRQAWVEIKTAAENVRKDHPGISDSPEFREIIEKVKQLEKRYRRPRSSDESQPPASDPSGPKSSD